MAGEWSRVPLGDLVQNFDSRRIPLSSREREKRRGPYPYYGATGVMDYVDDYLFEGLHLLIAEDGSVETANGKPFLQLVDGKFWVNNHAHVLRAATDSDTKFLYYALSTIAIRPYMSGSVQAKLSQANMNRIPVPYPPDERDRRAIAHILGTLDDKIELNRRMSETLEATARALFESWFVRFDPVRRNMARKGRGQPSPAASRHPLPLGEGRGEGVVESHAFDHLFPDRFVDSELGEIPEGWRVGTLGYLSEKPQYGYTASAKEEPVGPKFLRITDINKLPWIDWTTVPYCEIEPEDFEQYRLHSGDVLIARMADPGHGVVIEEQVEAVFASYLIRFRLKDQAYIRYIQYWLRSDGYWELVTSRHAGTTRASLNAQVLSSFQLIIPPKPIASAFRKIVNALRNKVVAAVNESRTLAALRDALLPKLISGEIRV